MLGGKLQRLGLVASDGGRHVTSQLLSEKFSCMKLLSQHLHLNPPHINERSPHLFPHCVDTGIPSFSI